MSDLDRVFDRLQDCFEDLIEEDIQALEEDLKFAFPDDFRRFLLRYNAARAAHPIAFHVRNTSRWDCGVNVVGTHGVIADERFADCDIRDTIWRYEKYLPDGLLPIAEGYNVFICIGRSAEKHGKIYVCDWGGGDEADSVYFVADSFAEFLSLLFCESEDEFNLEELPIFQAVEQGTVADVEAYLADGGAAACRNEQAHTLLMCAARCRWPKLVRRFLECGADPNAEDAEGYPPMYQAIRGQSVDGCKLLLAAGANPQWCDERGLTLYKIAWSHYAYRIAYTLQAHLDQT